MFRLVYLLVTLVALALYGAMAFWIEPRLSLAANGLILFDFRLTGYTVGEAQQYFDALQTGGRQVYLGYWFPVDMGFLLVLTAFFTLSIKALFPANHGFWKVVSIILPMAYGLSDVTENLLVSALFKYGVGHVLDGAVWLASLMTQIKFIVLGALVVLLLTGLLRRVLSRWQTP